VTPDPNDLGRRRVPLPGGGVLTVRPVAPTDVDGLVALYDGLSDDDRYRRFFSGFRPPRSFFERLVNVGERGGHGLVAIAGPDGEVASGARIVGEASYELLPNGDGELAIAVAADHRGWLGPYLLDALVEAAAARGVRNLEADVLVTNGRMLTLLRTRGYATMGSNDWTTLRLVIGTAGRTPVWPTGHGATGHADRPRVLVEVPGGRWHAGTEADVAGLQVIACSGPRGSRPRCPVLAGRPCPLAAAADAIVVSNAPDDDRWRALLEAHTDLHPGVPVCVERRAGRRPRDQPRLGPPRAGSAVSVDEHQGPRMIVDLVDRLASRHRSAAGAPPAAPSTARRRRRDELDRLTSVRGVLAGEALDQETEAESVGKLSSIDQHPADLGSETFERERELSLLEDLEAEIADVRRALVRLDRGGYGRCQACGRQIPDERLSAVPAARFCFEHQAAAEVIGGLET